MITLSTQSASEALNGVRNMLDADGYRLGVDVAEDRLVIDIEPTADACADCLVPAGTIETIMRKELESAGVSLDGVAFVLHHPGAAEHS